jgi:hypothetical protein
VPNKTLPKVLLVFLPLLLIIILLGLFIRAQKSNNPTSVNQTEITPAPTATGFIPSKWAGDEEVLSMEADLNSLEKKLQGVDLKQLPLLPPVLDMNINFK